MTTKSYKLADNAYSFLNESLLNAKKAARQGRYWSFAILHLIQSLELLMKEVLRNQHAFEMFRLIGALLESSIQPFLKELYCLALVANGMPVDPPVISRTDFGRIVMQFEKLLNDSHFVTPPPWNVRLNQWRNIAQHHSYKIDGENIVAHYGKADASGNDMDPAEVIKNL